MLSPFRLVLTLCSVLGVLKEGQQLNGSAAAHDEIKGKVFPRAQSEQPWLQQGVGAQSWAPPPALPSQPRRAALREVPPALRRFPRPLTTPPSRSLPRCQGSPGCPVQVSRSLAFPHRTQHLSVGRAPAAVPQNLPGTGPAARWKPAASRVSAGEEQSPVQSSCSRPHALRLAETHQARGRGLGRFLRLLPDLM